MFFSDETKKANEMRKAERERERGRERKRERERERKRERKREREEKKMFVFETLPFILANPFFMLALQLTFLPNSLQHG